MGEIDISSVPGLSGEKLRVTCSGKISPDAETAVRFNSKVLGGRGKSEGDLVSSFGVRGTAIKRPKTSDKGFKRPKTADRRRERTRKEVDDIIESLDQEDDVPNGKPSPSAKISKLGGPAKPLKKIRRAVIDEKISSLLKE